VTPSAETSETYVACLTPPGSAAIATLALRGPRAWEVVRELFRSRSASATELLTVEPGWFTLGRLGHELADEVVVALKRAAPTPWVEVHCHGGREVIRLLLETFEKYGVRVCTWQQLERLSAGHPLTALAAVALAQATTTRTAAILLDQYQGAFLRAVEATEAALVREDCGEAKRLLDELARHNGVGRHLTAPWTVVVAGAPNVGKSSLVNALTGFSRCVVAPTPGTTRDLVSTSIAVEGWPVDLTDTAGIRADTGPLEAQGIDLAQQAAAAADLCLWLLDASVPTAWPALATNRLHLLVNKVDLPAAWNLDRAPEALCISARTGAGLEELCHALAHWLVPDPPPQGAAVPFTPALCDRILEAREHCALGRMQQARRGLESLAGDVD
jgi:tRNA modification GTPase